MSPKFAQPNLPLIASSWLLTLYSAVAAVVAAVDDVSIANSIATDAVAAAAVVLFHFKLDFLQLDQISALKNSALKFKLKKCFSRRLLFLLPMFLKKILNYKYKNKK